MFLRCPSACEGCKHIWLLVTYHDAQCVTELILGWRLIGHRVFQAYILKSLSIKSINKLFPNVEIRTPDNGSQDESKGSNVVGNKLKHLSDLE